MQFRKLFFSLCCMVALGVSLAACSEDEELFDDSGSKVTLPVHRAFILNEGTQGANNATLSFYAPDGNADFIKDIFYTQNQAKLGDTGQALIEYNNDLYAIISGSRYLIRMNTAGVEKQRYEIPASEGDPRYLVADDGYIYMTQYGGRVTKLDANTLKVVATFTGGNNLEGIAECDGKLYVANSYLKNDAGYQYQKELFVINADNMQLETTLAVDINPNQVLEEDGKIYLGPVSTAAFACSGVFWNRELFEQAGISRFPETWEEFWKCCEKLKAAGITPLALHTEGTAWAAMLLATAEVAGSEEGAAFMKQLYPDTYQNEPGLEIAGTLKKLFQYTTQDALHNDFDVAYDNFVAGNAAMIPNGYWMIDKIPEEMQKKVCFSTFPENKLIGSPETFGWAVVSTYSEKVKKGAVEFLKFRTKLNKEQKEELLNSRTRQEGTLLDDYLKAYTGNPQIVPNYQVKWNSLLQENVLGECLAELVQGKITEQEFTQAEDESIRQFEEEQ